KEEFQPFDKNIVDDAKVEEVYNAEDEYEHDTKANESMPKQATKLELSMEYPRNSGARIGAAEEVKSCFKVGWSDESNPSRGFQYVYMTPEDHERIKSSILAHKLKLSNGEIR
ncbi:Acetyl-CoA Carboxylase, partial [Datura stramonium]|nr:Acetyl-CoA Carboxylase [Datura stramonium]